jgi:hypothetical protein
MMKKNLKKLNFRRFYKQVPLLKIPKFNYRIIDLQKKEDENMKLFNNLNDENYTKYEKYLENLRKNTKSKKKTKKLFPNIYSEYRHYFKSTNFSTIDTSASARKDNKIKTSIMNINSDNGRTKKSRNVTLFINPYLNNNNYYNSLNSLNTLNTIYKTDETSLDNNNNISNSNNKKEKILKLLDDNEINNYNNTYNTINHNYNDDDDYNKENKIPKKKLFYQLKKQRLLNLKKIDHFSVDFTNKIFNGCNQLKTDCQNFKTKINNKPKFIFVTEKDINNIKTKKDLGFTGKIKKGNAFKNMRIFKETKAIGTLNSDLAFSANKVIKKALNKNTDKFEDIKMEEKNFIQQQKIQKDLMKKTEEIINESIFRKNECIKSINKFYE